MSWKNALLSYIQHPERSPLVMKYNDRIVVMRDAYPKAKHHFLILPRARLDALSDLTREHLPLLAELRQEADETMAEYPDVDFQMGFHAIPSMLQLHMHVISTDFQSEALKNKKHWNSFTTDFFLTYDQVVDWIQDQGRVQVDRQVYEDKLKLPLRCHRCHASMANMPRLKAHIKQCQKRTA